MKKSISQFTISVLLISLIGTTMLSESASANNNRLTVVVSGLRNQNGQICLSLFSQGEGFPSKKNRAAASQCIPANAAARGAIFENLSPGQYAVALFQDANADGRLNTGFLGIPTEGFGFSRNPRIGTRAPRFEDAALSLAGQNTQIQVQLKYF